MEKIKEVEEARALMIEAMEWPVMKWLTEKKRVRKTADAANATLDRVEAEVQAGWDAELKKAYASGNGGTNALAKGLKQAHDAAIQARMQAEDTFVKAEKRLSTNLAREGCKQAMAGWELHEAAIRKAESARK